ncbi:putative DDE superfamily endonuclease domain-containing protein [Aphanomyces euteiches]|nr:putative DDE superfamily endonuclease domain-containing protein [Aphanomyces euteiches]
MRTKIARLLSKSLSTQQEWIVDFYKQNPVAFLDEAKKAFELRFKKYISVSSVWRIIHKFGFTWKILERRAMQDDVFRFFHELASINWSYHNIEFLDEKALL